MQKVVIGSDHAGFQMKERIKKELGSEFEFVDVGTHNGDSVDYPIYAEKVGQQVAISSDMKGVLVCGSGIGVSIAANKVNGIRAALCHNKRAAEMARLHNNANVIATSGREETFDDPVDVIRTFLTTDFSGEERHARRVQEMMEIEKRN
jgi:ribose 5-phosphate isomerase B